MADPSLREEGGGPIRLKDRQWGTGNKVQYLWGLQGPPETGPDSSAALGLGDWVPQLPLGPPAQPLMRLGETP